MTITVDIQDDSTADKILWFLENVKSEGLKIYTDDKKDKNIKDFEKIIDKKSDGAILLDKSVIFNPHEELSSDIS
ncbi:MAG: hypothetical protein DSY99_00230 [Candidatus Neomarinimicrobiota bacterium]|nr:MAG: hypothetical protein DSY99_00230 [Candidatus Neomarinimicrobiota bacterium]